MATLHVARRTTPHHPLTALTGWLTSRLRRHPHPGVAPDIEALRLSLPIDDSDRHALEDPAAEDAFARLAIDHPAEVAVASMRAADHEQMLLAARDEWFRHTHPAPMHRWSAQEVAAYCALMASVYRSRPGGGAA